MITSAIIYAAFGVLWAITSPMRILPDVSMPSGITGAMTTVSGYLATLYALLPITTAALLGVLALFLLVEAAILIYKGMMWVIRKIPGIS